MGLLDSVKGVVTNAIVDKAASALGIESGMAKSALKMFLPAIIGGVINKGSTEKGAGGLLDLFKNGGFGDDNLGDISGVLGDVDKRSSWLETGGDLLGSIFGNNQSGVLEMLLKATGISKGKGSTLLAFLAPLVINKLAGLVKSKGMNAAGLSSYLNEQKGDVMGLVPGLSSMLGGSASTASNLTSSGGSTSSSNSGGGGLLKWLLPLLIAAIAIWFFTKDGCNKTEIEDSTKLEESTSTSTPKVSDSKTVESTSTTTSTSAETSTQAVDPSTFNFNDKNDILSGSGAVVHPAGTYNVDAKGNLVDANGRLISAVSSLNATFASRLKSIMEEINLEKMKLMFSNMISKKEGAGNSYALSQVEFKDDGHLIKNFSKAEVEGLAAALKANVKGKIEVHVHSDDGKDKKASEKLTDMRANVIRDMLVTLGVDKGQIKAVGKAMEDEAKASLDKVDIVIK